MDDAMGPRASVWAILEKHHQERFDAYMVAASYPIVTGMIFVAFKSYELISICL